MLLPTRGVADSWTVGGKTLTRQRFGRPTRRGRLWTVAATCQDRHVGGGGGLAGRALPESARSRPLGSALSGRDQIGAAGRDAEPLALVRTELVAHIVDDRADAGALVGLLVADQPDVADDAQVDRCRDQVR